MEINNQIKKYRAGLNLSQEELAEKVYVTRQTISNWETGKSYPDIHSLLLLSSLFNVSLDQLIKGDIEIMKREIKSEEIREFDRYSGVFAILLIACIILPVPLVRFLGWAGIGIYVVLCAVMLAMAVKIEKHKKKYDIQTYKEITAFMNGETLDVIAKNREEAKRPYQKFLLAVGAGALAAIVLIVMDLILF